MSINIPEFSHLLTPANITSKKSISIAATYSREQIITKFVTWNQTTTRYSVWDTPCQFFTYLDTCPVELRTYHEVIFDGPQRLKFDIDLSRDELMESVDEFDTLLLSDGEDELDSLMNSLVDDIQEMIRRVYDLPSNTPDRNIVKCRSYDITGEKYSAHLIVDLVVDDSAEAREFTKRLIDYNLRWNDILDKGVNKRIQNFRISGCHKGECKNNPRIKEIINGDRIKTLIGWRDEYPRLLSIAPVINTTIDTSIVHNSDEVLKLCELVGILKDHKLRRRTDSLYEFDRIANHPTYCEICNQVHEKDNTVVVRVLATGAVFKSCRKKVGGVQIGEVIIPGMTPENLATLQPLALEDQITKMVNVAKNIKIAGTLFDSLPDGQKIIYDEPKIRQFTRVPTLCVHANMKMGKTKALHDYIALFPSTAIIRFISFRQTFSGNIKASFQDFDLYSELSGQISSNRLIIQVESLHRLMITPGQSAPDLLILDESESIFDQFNSGNIKETVMCWAKFQYLLKYSKHVIAMDALMGDRTFRMINKLRGDELNGEPIGITYHHNTYKNSTADNFYITGNKLKWLAGMYASIDAGKKIAVPVSSLIEAQVLHKSLCDKYPKLAISIYSSETPQADKRIHFAAVNTYWLVDVLIYTPTVTAGVSFEVKHFDKVFGYFTEMSCSVETCIQMIGRIRDVSCHEFVICISAFGNNLPTTLDEIMNSVHMRRENLTKTFDDTGLRVEFGPTGDIIYHKTDYFYMWVENQIVRNLSRNAFSARFITSIGISGATTHTLTDNFFATLFGAVYTMEGAAEISAAHSINRAEIRQETAQGISTAAEITTDEFSRITATLMAQEDVKPEDKLAYAKYKLRVDYNFHGDIDEEFVKLYSQPSHRRVYKNLHRIGKGTKTDLLRIQQEERIVNNHLMSNEQTMRDLSRKYVFDQHRYTLGMLHICGWSHLYSTEVLSGPTLYINLCNNEELFLRNMKPGCAEFEIKCPQIATIVANRENRAQYLIVILGIINKMLRVMYKCEVKATKDEMYHIFHSSDFTRTRKDKTKPMISIVATGDDVKDNSEISDDVKDISMIGDGIMDDIYMVEPNIEVISGYTVNETDIFTDFDWLCDE